MQENEFYIKIPVNISIAIKIKYLFRFPFRGIPSTPKRNTYNFKIRKSYNEKIVFSLLHKKTIDKVFFLRPWTSALTWYGCKYPNIKLFKSSECISFSRMFMHTQLLSCVNFFNIRFWHNMRATKYQFLIKLLLYLSENHNDNFFFCFTGVNTFLVVTLPTHQINEIQFWYFDFV